MYLILGALSYALTCIFSQDDEVGCTLLLHVENELRDVATASIMSPLQRVMHNLPMAPDVFRVHIHRVLYGCGDLYPPIQPAGADSEKALKGCLGYPMTCPKALIRLDPPITCTPPQPTPVGSANQEPLMQYIWGMPPDHKTQDEPALVFPPGSAIHRVDQLML